MTPARELIADVLRGKFVPKDSRFRALEGVHELLRLGADALPELEEAIRAFASDLRRTRGPEFYVSDGPSPPGLICVDEIFVSYWLLSRDRLERATQFLLAQLPAVRCEALRAGGLVFLRSTALSLGFHEQFAWFVRECATSTDPEESHLATAMLPRL